MKVYSDYCFDVDLLGLEPLQKEGKILPEEIDIENFISGRYHIKAFKGKKNIDIHYDLCYERKITCSRCLEENVVKSQIKDVVEAIEYESVNLSKDNMNEISEDKLIYYNGREICLYYIIRDMILLDEDMKYICTDDCKGLCPFCGENLNFNKCDCGKEKIKNNPFNILTDIENI